jgi:hypothetical protein
METQCNICNKTIDDTDAVYTKRTRAIATDDPLTRERYGVGGVTPWCKKCFADTFREHVLKGFPVHEHVPKCIVCNWALEGKISDEQFAEHWERERQNFD